MGYRILNQDEGAQAEVVLRGQQGVSVGERAILKNLAASPEAAQRYLSSIGYEVRTYPGAGRFNFAVRRAKGDPWKVVDPEGFDWQDIIDHTVEVAQGVAVGFGTAAGAGLASAATGAGTALGTEAIRQALGEVAGIPDNFDALMLGAQGLGGAAGPAVGAGVGAAGRYAIGAGARGVGAATGVLGRVGLEAGARVIGLKSTPALPGAQVLRERAAEATGKLFPTTRRVSSYFLAALHRIRRTPFPEKAAVTEMAETSPATVNFRPLYEELVDLTTTKRAVRETVTRGVERAGTTTRVAKTLGRADEATGEIIPEVPPTFAGGKVATTTTGVTKTTRERLVEEPVSSGAAELRFLSRANPREIRTLLDDIRPLFGDSPLDAIPVKTAIRIKELLQQRVRDAGGYAQRVQSESFLSLERKVAGQLRAAVSEEMGGPTGAFSVLMREVERKTDLLHAYDEIAGIGRQMTNTQRLIQAEKFLEGVYDQSIDGVIIALNDMERLFGVRVLDLIRRAEVGARFGRAGRLGEFPRLTATGQPVGTTLLGGSRSGLGLIPAIAGAIGATPRGVVRLTQAGMQLGKTVEEGLNALVGASQGLPGIFRVSGGAARPVSLQAVASSYATGGGKHTARQDAPPRRKLRLSQ
jgi:hypothetical protein